MAWYSADEQDGCLRMMDMAVVQSELIAARPYFKKLSPGPGNLLAYRYMKHSLKMVLAGYGTYKAVKAMEEEPTVAHFVGDFIGGRIISALVAPAKREIRKGHILVNKNAKVKRDMHRKNGMGGRSWITEPGKYQMVIVFHDANRAGPHIDVHIGQLSMVYRVKPDLYAKLRYNNQGYLTEDSKKLLINHVRSEIANGARVPQNLDHSSANARSTWTNGDPLGKNYGDGRTRQVISETTVDVYKTGPGHPIEMYAPALNSHRSQYIYQIYPGDGKSAPILIWGNRTHQPPRLEDRLHLKMIDPSNEDQLIAKADMSTSTAKYDGSSCYIVITKDGTTVWSPRQSVKTGEQIEYTFKLDGVANTRSDETIVAMGEVLFKPRRTGIDRWRKERTGSYFSSASGGGLLNGHDLIPNDVQPEIRLYRVDRVGRTNTSDLPFWDNRLLQEDVARLNPEVFKVVELMDPNTANAHGFEGVVVVPEDGSINDGFKMKWTMDPHDWRIDRVEFKHGEKGGMAGVVYATSLESGKEFKLGPGQVGDRELTQHMMDNPELYEGVVLKVCSRRGHEGRAAKVIEVHTDKGVAPV
jgi:hypothetical protein